MRGLRWLPNEDLQLRALVSVRQYTAADIARIMGKTRDSVRSRARRLRLSTDVRKWDRPARNPDVSTWSEADRLSAWADIPQELAELVVGICEERGLSVKLVRANGKQPDLLSCRNQIARRAKDLGYSYPLIGRAINRDHTTVIHAVRNSSPDSTGSAVGDATPSDAYTARWNTPRTELAA